MRAGQRRSAPKHMRMLRLLGRLVRIVGVITVTAAVALALTCTAVAIQGQRNEVRPADALLIVSPQLPDQATVNYLIDLYRRGYASRLILANGEAERLRADLAGERYRLPEAALLLAEGGRSRRDRIGRAAALARQHDLESILVVDQASALLLDLKMAQDLGLKAYGTPVPGAPPDFAALLFAGLAYWQYVLLGT